MSFLIGRFMPLPARSKKESPPWLDSTWQHLQAARSSGRLAHAYLLSGVEGLGKNHFAESFSASLLCSTLDDQAFPCGACHSCQLFQARSHPDCLIVEPEEGSRIIKIDQIRRLINFSSKTSPGFKVIIVTLAEQLNISASNALLKILEEPGKDTVLLLVSNQPSLLSATIRSRCQILKCLPPTAEKALDWLVNVSQTEQNKEILNIALSLSDGAPLKALALIASDEMVLRQQCFDAWLAWQQRKTDLMPLVEQFQTMDLKVILHHYTLWVMDLIKMKLADTGLVNVDFENSLRQVMKAVSLPILFAYLDRLNDVKRLLDRKINLNEQLLLEDLLIAWLKPLSGGF